MRSASVLIVVAIAIVLVVGIYSLGGALAAGPFLGQATNASATPSMDDVRVGRLSVLATLPVFIAEREGFFARHGLQVTVDLLPTSNAAVDALAAERIDVLVPPISGVTAFTADIRDPGKLKVFTVSDYSMENQFDSILVRNDSKLVGLKDLEGRTIAVFPGSTATNLLKRLFEQNGVDGSKVQFVPLGQENQLAALESGAVDAVHAYEPTVTIGLAGGMARKLYPSVYATLQDHNPFGVGLMSARFVRERPQAATRFVAAMEDAFAWQQQHETEARGMLPELFKLSLEVSQRVVLTRHKTLRQAGTESLQRFTDLLAEIGELPHRVDVNATAFAP